MIESKKSLERRIMREQYHMGRSMRRLEGERSRQENLRSNVSLGFDRAKEQEYSERRL